MIGERTAKETRDSLSIRERPSNQNLSTHSCAVSASAAFWYKKCFQTVGLRSLIFAGEGGGGGAAGQEMVTSLKTRSFRPLFLL